MILRIQLKYKQIDFLNKVYLHRRYQSSGLLAGFSSPAEYLFKPLEAASKLSPRHDNFHHPPATPSLPVPEASSGDGARAAALEALRARRDPRRGCRVGRPPAARPAGIPSAAGSAASCRSRGAGGRAAGAGSPSARSPPS